MDLWKDRVFCVVGWEVICLCIGKFELFGLYDFVVFLVNVKSIVCFVE